MFKSKLVLLSFLALTGVGFGQNTGLTFTHGTDQHFDVRYDAALVPQTGLTVEAWIIYDEASVPVGDGLRWPTIVRQDVTPTSESFFLRVGASNFGNRSLEFAIRTASGIHFATYLFAPGQFSSWTHLAATWDGSAMSLFVDGVQVASFAAAMQPLLDTGGVLRVGNGDKSVSGYETWSGQIDEVRLWPFARSAEEIQETMTQELSSMPAGVVTFNLNNDYSDSSSGFSGSPTGAPSFTASPALTTLAANSDVYGSSTSTCGTLGSGIGSVPTVGNSNFVVHCKGAPASTVGCFFASRGALDPPLTIGGIDLHIDPAQIRISIFSLTGQLSGKALAPIPNDPSLVDQTFHSQFFYTNIGCGPSNIVASDGCAVTIQ